MHARAVARLLLLTPGRLADDPRARRAAAAAHGGGLEVAALCGANEPGPDASLPPEITVASIGSSSVTRLLRSAGLGGMQRSRPVVRELRGIFRLLRLARVTLALTRRGQRLGPADVVHANDFETLPAGHRLATALRARLVYDAHEIYADQEPDPPRLHAAAVRRLERRLARNAAAVVTVSEPIARELETSLGLPRTPLVVLNCPPLAPVVAAGAATPTRGRLRAVYQGAAGPGRDLEDLLAAATPSVDLAIRVVGIDAGALRARAAASGLDGLVRVLDPVPAADLVSALAGFDVGLIINRPVTRNDELVFPNKLFEYLMAGLAVVVPRLPALAPFVEREGVGLTYAPGDPADLARVLGELAADRPRLAEMQRRARAAAEERYNAEAQVPVLLEAWGL